MLWPVPHAGFAVPLAIALACATAIAMVLVLRRGRGVGLWVGTIGFVVPWIVGLAVKWWHMAHGTPTWPISWFLRALPLLLPVGLLLAAPLIVVGALYTPLLGQRPATSPASVGATAWVVGGLVVGTVGSMAIAFTEVFWVFDPMVFLGMPFIWATYAPGAALGGVAGWATGRALARRR
jgi:hypothetical protein